MKNITLFLINIQIIKLFKGLKDINLLEYSRLIYISKPRIKSRRK